MKKIIMIAALIFAVSWAAPEKTYTVKADIQTWQAVLNVIDLSTAEPKQRIAVRDFIIAQLSDTTINKK